MSVFLQFQLTTNTHKHNIYYYARKVFHVKLKTLISVLCNQGFKDARIIFKDKISDNSIICNDVDRIKRLYNLSVGKII